MTNSYYWTEFNIFVIYKFVKILPKCVRKFAKKSSIFAQNYIQLGFPTTANFCRYFKHATGMTPQEYREQSAQ